MQASLPPLPAEKRGAGRLPSLDGLRAVAILMVLVSHFQYAAGFPTGKFPLVFVFFDGELGVRIFFVISGFIITRLLLDEDRTCGGVSLRLFYIRRALRILPVYGAYLGMLALLSVAGRYSDSPSSWLGCLTFTRNMAGRGDSGTEHFWSLAIEEQFYLCWPLLFFLLCLGRRRALALAILAGISLASLVVRASFNPAGLGHGLAAHLLGARSLLRYADSIALGCFGAFLQDRFTDRPRAAAGLLAALLLAAEQFYDRGLPAHPPFVFPAALTHAIMPALQATTAVFLLLCMLRPAKSFLYSILNGKIMMKIGVLSYSLYVWHFAFLYAFAPRAWPFPALYQWTVWWVPAVVVSILSYEFLETPFLRLRRTFRRGAANPQGFNP